MSKLVIEYDEKTGSVRWTTEGPAIPAKQLIWTMELLKSLAMDKLKEAMHANVKAADDVAQMTRPLTGDGVEKLR